MMEKILSVMLILAMAITAVGCSDTEHQGRAVTATTKIEGINNNIPTIDEPADCAYVVNDSLSYWPFYSVESSFAFSRIIVRGICRAVPGKGAREYFFDVVEVYCGDYTGNTLYVLEHRDTAEYGTLYEVGKEYYLPLIRYISDETYMPDPAPVRVDRFDNVYEFSLPVYETQEHLVLRDTPISEYAREETVLALSSPDTAAEYFRTRRFSEIVAEQDAEKNLPKSENTN